MKSILVTGGAGFIGSNFVKYLLKEKPNTKVINLDKLTYAGNLLNLTDIENNGNYHFIKGDIKNKELVEFIVKEHGVEGIINFAAESHVDRSILGPDEFIETNVRGTFDLLEITRKMGLKRFLQVSTDEVYGSLGKEGYFTETTPLDPSSPYSSSKASADMITTAYNKTYGMDTVITRCSNNYGPYQFPEKLIPLMIKNALEDKQLPVYGDGKNIRDWLHVYDHCRAILMVYEKGKSGEVYNVGGNNEWMNIDIVKLILSKLNKSEDLITFVKDRPGHDRRYAIDAGKIKKELGFSPEYTFEKGIDETIKWYLDNQEWVKTCISGEYMDYYGKQYVN